MTVMAAGSFTLFWLVLARVSGVMAIAPVLSSGSIPRMVQVVIALGLTFALLPAASPTAGPIPENFGPFAGLLLEQLAIGIVIGLVARVIFSAAQIAGGVLDLQLGFAIGALLNPLSSGTTTILSNFFELLLTVVYLVSGGFALFVWDLGRSYRFLPIGGTATFSAAAQTVVAGLDQAMLLAVVLALPALALGLVVNVVLGLFGRAIPQMNPLQVAVPAQIIVGLGVLVVTLPHMLGLLTNLSQDVSVWVGRLWTGVTP